MICAPVVGQKGGKMGKMQFIIEEFDDEDGTYIFSRSDSNTDSILHMSTIIDLLNEYDKDRERRHP